MRMRACWHLFYQMLSTHLVSTLSATYPVDPLDGLCVRRSVISCLRILRSNYALKEMEIAYVLYGGGVTSEILATSIAPQLVKTRKRAEFVITLTVRDRKKLEILSYGAKRKSDADCGNKFAERPYVISAVNENEHKHTRYAHEYM